MVSGGYMYMALLKGYTELELTYKNEFIDKAITQLRNFNLMIFSGFQVSFQIKIKSM